MIHFHIELKDHTEVDTEVSTEKYGPSVLYEAKTNCSGGIQI